MKIICTVPNIFAPDLDAASALYRDVLGFEQVMDHGWIRTFAAPGQPHTQMSLIHADPSGLQPALSIEVDDADAAYAEAQGRGLKIAYDLHNEPWGVRRFFVENPAGNLVNIVSHRHA